MKIQENCTVICRNPVMVREDSNRIDTNLSDWTAFENIKIDFSTCLTIDEVVLCLERMERVNLHIMGSRGYVYSSKALADFIEEIDESSLPILSRFFPRTFGLRDKIKEVAIK